MIKLLGKALREVRRDLSATITTILACGLLLCCALAVRQAIGERDEMGHLRVGIILNGDLATAYSANFARAERALEDHFGERVSVEVAQNVPQDEALGHLRAMAESGCGIIFLCSADFTEAGRLAALDYHNVQFCQAAPIAPTPEGAPGNYHTFTAALHEARFVAGVIAGMKLRELIDAHLIEPEEAMVGYVIPDLVPEVMSGMAAFLIGVRTVTPTATMRVRRTHAWSDFSRDEGEAEALIKEGCVVISHHTDTAGTAMACERHRQARRPLFHVGTNLGMSEVAPDTSLLSLRPDWNRYIIGAVEATLRREPIESSVPGRAFGQDMVGGFRGGWLQILDLNPAQAPRGARERIATLVEEFSNNEMPRIFYGNYLGVDPDNPRDSMDMRHAFRECSRQATPSFHYLLSWVMNVEN
ncbi:MAG: BMP family ABC transporter substrate-binding protein [Succinivibrionaceae bacterium]|nr:BMP family ABC transporter substrate-binding protein [Succinivibrionaceae bacterium]